MTANQRKLVENLHGEECECGESKKSGFSYCGQCYWHLPKPMQKALYRRIHHGYAEAFEAARLKLIEVGRIDG